MLSLHTDPAVKGTQMQMKRRSFFRMAAAGTAAGFVAAVESGLPARAYAEDTDATDPTTTDPTTPE